MKYISIRVSPSKIFYAIGEKLEDRFVYSLDSVIVPQILETPKKLSYIRNVFESIITQQQIVFAGIRLAETNSKTQSLDRVYIEAVIQEFFSNSTIEHYRTLRLAGMSSILNLKNQELKEWIDNKNTPDRLQELFEDWSTLTKEDREALVVLFCTMEAFK
ncbi:hypothetical protein Q9R23_11725 [Exiguobacterium sp. BRG2]|uniref:hypothetical protein n=1 Tax=Exiguobacterium sp. BRG2 TaxID=2962584 RepID=UPI00288154AA|nr:hypothetical protein [Exiguobacterium sp. BRG2]MDT0173642.1 hypothetical protein [Exiguobacterium sp. BRG2]